MSLPIKNLSIKTEPELKIGNTKLKSRVIAAPMAGITDTVLRQIIRLYSKNSLLMSEMLSSEALKFNKEQKIIRHSYIEYPLSFQISGHKPLLMAEGAKKMQDEQIQNLNSDYGGEIVKFIDINMGCPAPKIVKNGDGAKLMTDLKLASEIISEVKKAITIPLTVKCRLGWDLKSKNHVEFAKMAESCGAEAIIVHGRTKSQMYSGKADWHSIGEIKQAIKIPVIGNGDIDSPQKAAECMKVSGCDGIAIGRAIMGDPSLIFRIEKYIHDGELLQPPSIEEKIETAILHCKKEIEHMDSEINGIKFMRKFYAHYVTGVRNAVKYRTALVHAVKLCEIEAIFHEMRTDLAQNQ